MVTAAQERRIQELVGRCDDNTLVIQLKNFHDIEPYDVRAQEHLTQLEDLNPFTSTVEEVEALLQLCEGFCLTVEELIAAAFCGVVQARKEGWTPTPPKWWTLQQQLFRED